MHIPTIEMLDALEDLSGIGHWTITLQSGAVFWSPRVFQIYGLSAEATELSLSVMLSALAGSDKPRLEEALSRAEGGAYTFELRLWRANRTRGWVTVRGRPWTDARGEVIGHVGIIEDITDQREQAAHQQMLSEVVYATPEGIVITDPSGAITWVNPGFEAISGYSLAECVGRQLGAFLSGPGTDEDTLARIRDAIAREASASVEILNYNRFGDPHWIKLSLDPRRGPRGELLGFMVVEVDISEQREIQLSLQRQRNEMELINFKLGRQRRELLALSEQRQEAVEQLQQEVTRREALEKELRRLASTDELTHLLNRRAFLERAEREIRRSRRYGGPLGLISLDIDHFKSVNDTYGHATGDAALRALSSVIRTVTRRELDAPARIGGEEFAILLPEAGLLAAEQAAERLRAAIAGHRQADIPPLTCSFGVAVLRPDDPDILAVLQRADAALYRAKAAGRNCVRTATRGDAEE